MKLIESYQDAAEVRQLMANAKRLGNMEVFWKAFRRVCEIEGSKFEDPLERDFYSTLAAYEEILSEKHGRKVLASRTRQKLKNKGYIACLEDWARNAKRTEGFSTLVQTGHLELTGEYLVLKYPQHFSKKAVENAEMVLDWFRKDPLRATDDHEPI